MIFGASNLCSSGGLGATPQATRLALLMALRRPLFKGTATPSESRDTRTYNLSVDVDSSATILGISGTSAELVLYMFNAARNL